MELKINKYNECCYDINGKSFFVGKVFKDGKSWFAVNAHDDFKNDLFHEGSFPSKKQAIKCIDETMKNIFKRILDEP